MDSPKTTRIIAKILWKPFAWLAALTLLLGLAYTLYGLVSHPAISTRQMVAIIQQAGHGKVDFVQDHRVDGILAAQVRYPNHSLHTVFFLAHDGKSGALSSAAMSTTITANRGWWYGPE